MYGLCIRTMRGETLHFSKLDVNCQVPWHFYNIYVQITPSHQVCIKDFFDYAFQCLPCITVCAGAVYRLLILHFPILVFLPENSVMALLYKPLAEQSHPPRAKLPEHWPECRSQQQISSLKQKESSDGHSEKIIIWTLYVSSGMSGGEIHADKAIASAG